MAITNNPISAGGAGTLGTIATAGAAVGAGVASAAGSTQSDAMFALTASYEKICSEFRNDFPKLSIVERGYRGSVDGRTYHGPAIGVAQPDTDGAVIAGYGQMHFPDSHFVVLPSSPENLFVEGGKLYTGSGIRFAWSEGKLEIGYETYTNPHELGALLYFGSFQTDDAKRIERWMPTFTQPSLEEQSNHDELSEGIDLKSKEGAASIAAMVEKLAMERTEYGSFKELAQSAYARAVANKPTLDTTGAGDSATRRYIASAETFAILSELFFERQNYDKAIEYCLMAIERTPEEFSLWINLGTAYKDKGEIDKAIECYNKALECDPKAAVVWFNLGISFGDKGEVERAIECYNKAVELDPTEMDAWNNLGGELKNKGEYDKAIVCWEKLLELDPTYAAAPTWKMLGLAYFVKDKFDRSIECFSNALRFDPEDREALMGIGSAYGRKGETEKAIECHKRFLASYPEDAGVWLSLGGELLKKGEFLYAVLCFERTLAIDPDTALARKGLEMARNAMSSTDRP